MESRYYLGDLPQGEHALLFLYLPASKECEKTKQVANYAIEQ